MTRDPLVIQLALFRDAEDNIPVARPTRWEDLPEVISVSHPPVRADIVRLGTRRIQFFEDVLAAFLAGRDADRLGRYHWYRDLERTAVKARGVGADEAGVRRDIEARAVTIRDSIRRKVKELLAAWNSVAFKPNSLRIWSNALGVYTVNLDFDDGTSVEEAMAPWQHWPFLLHTTWSHTEDHPKFRIIVPMAEPVPSEGWLRVWHWASQMSGGHIDAKCKDVNRVYFRPAVQSVRSPYRFLIHDGGEPFLRLDWRSLPSEPAFPSAQRHDTPRGARARDPAPSDAVRAFARRLLRVDRDARVQAARLLDASTSETRAWGVACPCCGRDSVWFMLDPTRKSTAECNHKETCGWFGGLDVLLDARGVSHGK